MPSSTRGARPVPHRDAFERINFLYQAAHAALSLPQPDFSLCRHYVRALRLVVRRLVLRLDPNIKRSLCRRCDILLVPGLTCTVRSRANRFTHMVVLCSECGTLKRYPVRDGYKLAVERAKAAAAAATVSAEEPPVEAKPAAVAAVASAEEPPAEARPAAAAAAAAAAVAATTATVVVVAVAGEKKDKGKYNG